MIPDPKKYLPKKQLVADDVKSSRASCWVEFTTYCANYRPYISMNNPEVERRDFLMVDCDHDGFDEFPGSFPMPIVTVITPNTGRHHHIWKLKTSVLTGQRARPAPQRLLSAVERAFIGHLGGDEAYTNRLTKNPFFDPKTRMDDVELLKAPPNSPLRTGWRTIWWENAEPIDLKKASIWCDEEPVFRGNRKRERPDPRIGLGRNIAVFDYARHWAYDNWTGECSHVHDVAQAYNASFPIPLPNGEVTQTANSICQFMETRYTGKSNKAPKRIPQEERIGLILHAEDKLLEDLKRHPTSQQIADITAIPLRSVQRLLKVMADNDIMLENSE